MSATSLPLVPALRPSWVGTTAGKITIVLAGTALLALSAKLEVPMWPVPITGQTLVVLLLGFALGPRLAPTSVLAYLGAGALGLPVFSASAGAAGPAVLAGTTAGYLWGFVVAAALTGYLAERGWHRRRSTVVAGMVLGNLVIYAFGATWLASLTDASTAWDFGVVPFLVGDAIKIAIAVALLPIVARFASEPE